nr:hypothetical protein [Microcystis aeruginosa]
MSSERVGSRRSDDEITVGEFDTFGFSRTPRGEYRERDVIRPGVEVVGSKRVIAEIFEGDESGFDRSLTAERVDDVRSLGRDDRERNR